MQFSKTLLISIDLLQSSTFGSLLNEIILQETILFRSISITFIDVLEQCTDRQHEYGECQRVAYVSARICRGKMDLDGIASVAKVRYPFSSVDDLGSLVEIFALLTSLSVVAFVKGPSIGTWWSNGMLQCNR